MYCRVSMKCKTLDIVHILDCVHISLPGFFITVCASVNIPIIALRGSHAYSRPISAAGPLQP